MADYGKLKIRRNASKKASESLGHLVPLPRVVDEAMVAREMMSTVTVRMWSELSEMEEKCSAAQRSAANGKSGKNEPQASATMDLMLTS